MSFQALPSAVLARVRAPSRAQFRELARCCLGRRLGAVSGDTSILLQAPVRRWFRRQSGTVSCAILARIRAQSVLGCGRHLSAALGAIGARLWAPSGRGFGHHRGGFDRHFGAVSIAGSARIRPPFRRRFDRHFGADSIAISTRFDGVTSAFELHFESYFQRLCAPFRASFLALFQTPF